MPKLITALILFYLTPGIAAVVDPVHSEKGIVSKHVDSFYDSSVDYTLLYARITDRDQKGKTYKMRSENNNIKFFRAGDALDFIEVRHQEKICRAFVQGVEQHHLVVHVPHIELCRDKRGNFRIGTRIRVHSDILKERILYAGQYRLILFKRKEDLLRQFGQVNEFLWTFKQEQVKLASYYDKKVLQINEQKKQGLDDLQAKRREYIQLQKVLAERLNFLDENLLFYRIERQELFYDRWYRDRDLGLPVSARPLKEIATNPKEEEKHRWHQF